MSVDQILNGLNQKCGSRIDYFATELTKIRSGRVTPALVEHIKIEAYGNTMPLNQLATISTPDAKTITIDAWDKSIVGSIEKSLLKAEVGATPSNDGQLIRLNFPPLSEERRKELVKLVNKNAEECRVAMRQARREQLAQLHKLDKSLSEDEIERIEEKIQKALSQLEAKVNEIADKKSKELTTL